MYMQRTSSSRVGRGRGYETRGRINVWLALCTHGVTDVAVGQNSTR